MWNFIFSVDGPKYLLSQMPALLHSLRSDAPQVSSIMCYMPRTRLALTCILRIVKRKKLPTDQKMP